MEINSSGMIVFRKRRIARGFYSFNDWPSDALQALPIQVAELGAGSELVDESAFFFSAGGDAHYALPFFPCVSAAGSYRRSGRSWPTSARLLSLAFRFGIQVAQGVGEVASIGHLMLAGARDVLYPDPLEDASVLRKL